MQGDLATDLGEVLTFMLLHEHLFIKCSKSVSAVGSVMDEQD